MKHSLPLLALAACTTTEPAPEVAYLEQELAQALCQATPLTQFNTDKDEGRLVFSPDGNLALWHREHPEFGLEIVESRRVHGQWTAPQRVAFATPNVEFDPFIALDGRTIFYTSHRPAPGDTEQRADGDIWKVTRTAAGTYSAPVRLGSNVNTDANEFFPSQTLDGALLWNSDREGGSGAWDLWRARGSAAAEPLPGELNTDLWEFNPSPTPFGNLLAFASLDPDPAAPYSDVFFSFRLRGEYTAGINAGACINTELEEYHPTIDWARGRVIFVRRNLTTSGDFYEAPLPAALLSLL